MRSALACVMLVCCFACARMEPSPPRYVVFFAAGSAQLDGPARGVIADAAQRADASPTAAVDVIGYADSVGSPQADVQLSQQRAQAVADALIARGVSASRIVRQGEGRGNGDAAIARRRVEIAIGGA